MIEIEKYFMTASMNKHQKCCIFFMLGQLRPSAEAVCPVAMFEI